MEKQERLEKFQRENPDHYLFRITKSEKQQMEKAERGQKAMIARLKRYAIADEVGLTKQRISQILQKIS